MKRAPITKQRSAWIERHDVASPIPGVEVRWFYRRVNDGTLWSCVGDEPEIGWHMSISYRNHNNNPTRYPTWDEIAHARDVLLPVDVGFVMHLPPDGQYVAVHPTTFHLHQHPTPERQQP